MKSSSPDSRSSRGDLTICSSSPGSSVSSASSDTRILSAASSSLCPSSLSSSILPFLSDVNKFDGAVMGQLQFCCCVRFSTPASASLFSHVPQSLVTRDSHQSSSGTWEGRCCVAEVTPCTLHNFGTLKDSWAVITLKHSEWLHAECDRPHSKHPEFYSEAFLQGFFIWDKFSSRYRHVHHIEEKRLSQKSILIICSRPSFCSW